ncbi:MAG: carboxypeptidase-like regulatory domain-containing protein [Nitrososphaeraceae archaeon]
MASPNDNPTLETTTTSSNSTSTSTEPQLATVASVQPQGPPANLAARGTINSLVAVPQTKWIAAGNWSMDVNQGNLTGFLTNMSFFDERGTATHTHEFLNFRPDADYKIIAQLPNSSLFVRGLMDVGTNHKVVWKSVPTTIDIKGGKTISIAVDDKATNSHFASQPILGVVSNLASGLKVQVTPAKSTVSSGDDQLINVTVSDSTSNAPITGVKLSGVMIDAFPGAKVLIKNMNSTEPIETSKIEGKKFSGVTDENGQFSITEPISSSKRAGTYTIVVTASAKGYNPISEIETFKVEK